MIPDQRMSDPRLCVFAPLVLSSYSLARPPIPRMGEWKRAELGMPSMELHSISARGPAIAKGLLPGVKRSPFLASKILAPRCPGLIDCPRLFALASQLPAKRLAVTKA